MQALAGEHDAGLDQLLVELAHLGEEFRARHLAGLGCFAGFDDDHEFHWSCPF
jgi:hypothetical protein